MQRGCAVVVKGNRFCMGVGIYQTEIDGYIKRVCGTHRRGRAVIGRVVPARRELYRAKRTHTDQPVDLITLIGVKAMPFQIEAKAGGEYNAEDYAPPGIYTAVVESVLPYEGTKYMSDEKQIQARVTWTITDGPLAGKKAERLYSPSLNEKSHLYPVFQALTGVTPTPGQSYDIEALLVGKSAQIVVMAHTTQAGYQRTRVENVLPIQQGPAANGTAKPKRTRVIEVEEDDDDLADA